MSEKPVREHDKVMLRLPDGVREMLKLQADHNKRSMNAEIVARLLETLEPWKPGEEPVLYTGRKIMYPAESFDIDTLIGRIEKVEEALSKNSGKK